MRHLVAGLDGDGLADGGGGGHEGRGGVPVVAGISLGLGGGLGLGLPLAVAGVVSHGHGGGVGNGQGGGGNTGGDNLDSAGSRVCCISNWCSTLLSCPTMAEVRWVLVEVCWQVVVMTSSQCSVMVVSTISSYSCCSKLCVNI